MIVPVAKHAAKHPRKYPDLTDAPTQEQRPLSELLRLPAGAVDLSSIPSDATLGFPGAGKGDADRVAADLRPELDELQERLFATGRTTPEGAPRVLLVLQGMDTSGKGGVVRHAIGMVDPQGVDITSFKSPTKTELAHPFLWRIERALPAPGMIGVFDRSHYEDVLIVRVRNLVPEDVWGARYAEINAWEEELVASGTTIVKCFLHVSHDRQKERLLERLEDPTKYWKYNPGDVDERALWPAYTEAYEAALERCSTQHAPWFVVPADRKWYRNWAVAQLLVEHLRGLDLTWPAADYDVDAEKRRVTAS